jgi:hypothetical protein
LLSGLWKKVQHHWPCRGRFVPREYHRFTVACECGREVAGARQASYQVVDCPGCGKKVFVLGYSVYPPVETVAEKPSAPSPVRSNRWTWAAAGVALLALLLAVLVILLSMPRPEATHQEVPTLSPAEIRRQIFALLQQVPDDLAVGHFALASRKVKAAHDLHEQTQCLSKEEAGNLNQLRAEVRLYEDLLEPSLEELLQEASSCPAEEWQARFAKRYQGKSLVLDTVVKRAPDKKAAASYRIQVRGEAVHLALEDLQLFQEVSFPDPQRTLFGARLAAIQQEHPRGWTVHFEPHSGVLVTEVKALTFCCPALEEGEILPILNQQKIRINPNLLQK